MRVCVPQAAGWLEGIVPAKRPQRLPIALDRAEVAGRLAVLEGDCRIMATLLYGAGLRPRQCRRLRVKDIEFGRDEILAREGEGNENRGTILPGSAREPRAAHLVGMRSVHQHAPPRLNPPEPIARSEQGLPTAPDPRRYDRRLGTVLLTREASRG